jgi:hypothetical protein
MWNSTSDTYPLPVAFQRINQVPESKRTRDREREREKLEWILLYLCGIENVRKGSR